MAHFDNRAQQIQYESQYCAKCIHYKGCPIRLLWTDDDKASVLTMFIPAADVICEMFISNLVRRFSLEDIAKIYTEQYSP